MVIGLIADTHGLLRPGVASVFAGVDLIVHAGDVGGNAVIAGVSALAPTMAVSGNVDDRQDPMLAVERSVSVGSLTMHVSHGGELGRPTPEGLLARYDADILVFGHTHRVLEHRAADGRVVLNPGSAGPRRFRLPTTLMTIVVVNRTTDVRIHTL